MKITMHVEEIALLRSFLTEAESYFEYGVGGSTFLANQLVGRRVCAVDTNQKWIDQVRAAIGTTEKVLHLRHVDLGPIGDWGTPTTREKEDSFPEYSSAILEAGGDFDFCLVDGRFRVASFLQALLCMNVGAPVAIHDYGKRPQYELIERYARPIAGKHSLKVFVRRHNCDLGALARDLELHRFVTD